MDIFVFDHCKVDDKKVKKRNQKKKERIEKSVRLTSFVRNSIY